MILKGDNKLEKLEERDAVSSNIGTDQKDEFGKATNNAAFASLNIESRLSSDQRKDQNCEPKNSTAEAISFKAPNKESSEQHSKGWQSIPKPKGHSALNYARWDSVEDDSSEDDSDDDDDEQESQPQYRFRVKTIGVRPVK